MPPKWDVKNGSAYVLTFFSLISDGLGSVIWQTMYKPICPIFKFTCLIINLKVLLFNILLKKMTDFSTQRYCPYCYVEF